MKRGKRISVLLAGLLIGGCMTPGYDYRIEQYEGPTHESLATLFIHRSASDRMKQDGEAGAFLKSKLGSETAPRFIMTAQTLNGDRYLTFVLIKPEHAGAMTVAEVERLARQIKMMGEVRVLREVKGYLRDEPSAAR